MPGRGNTFLDEFRRNRDLLRAKRNVLSGEVTENTSKRAIDIVEKKGSCILLNPTQVISIGLGNSNGTNSPENSSPKPRNNISNETTRYLEELELEFANNEEELEIIRAITVAEDGHLNIAGYVHKLGICSAEANEESGIYANEGHTLFKHEAAMKFTETQTGYVPYTYEELEKLMNSIPGKSNGRHVEIILKLLQIPLAGYKNLEDKISPVEIGAYIWTSDRLASYATYCYISKYNTAPNFISNCIEHAFCLILRKNC